MGTGKSFDEELEEVYVPLLGEEAVRSHRSEIKLLYNKNKGWEKNGVDSIDQTITPAVLREMLKDPRFKFKDPHHARTYVGHLEKWIRQQSPEEDGEIAPKGAETAEEPDTERDNGETWDGVLERRLEKKQSAQAKPPRPSQAAEVPYRKLVDEARENILPVLGIEEPPNFETSDLKAKIMLFYVNRGGWEKRDEGDYVNPAVTPDVRAEMLKIPLAHGIDPSKIEEVTQRLEELAAQEAGTHYDEADSQREDKEGTKLLSQKEIDALLDGKAAQEVMYNSDEATIYAKPKLKKHGITESMHIGWFFALCVNKYNIPSIVQQVVEPEKRDIPRSSIDNAVTQFASVDYGRLLRGETLKDVIEKNPQP